MNLKYGSKINYLLFIDKFSKKKKILKKYNKNIKWKSYKYNKIK